MKKHLITCIVIAVALCATVGIGSASANSTTNWSGYVASSVQKGVTRNMHFAGFNANVTTMRCLWQGSTMYLCVGNVTYSGYTMKYSWTAHLLSDMSVKWGPGVKIG